MDENIDRWIDDINRWVDDINRWINNIIYNIIIRSTYGRGADIPFFFVSAMVQYWYR